MSDHPQKPDAKGAPPGKASAPATSAAISTASGPGNLLRQLQERLVYLERRVAQQEQIIEHQRENPDAPLQVKPLPSKGPTLADLHRQAQALHAAVAEREKQLQDQAQLITRVKQEREQVVLTFQQLRTQAEALQRVHRAKLQELQKTQSERDALAQQVEEIQGELEHFRQRVDTLEQELEWTRGQIPSETPVDEALTESLAPDLEEEAAWPIDTDVEPESSSEPDTEAAAEPKPAVDAPVVASRPRTSRWSTALILLSGLVLAGANLATWLSPERTYVSGGVIIEDESLLDMWAESAPDTWQTKREPFGRLMLLTLSEDPERAGDQLARWIDAMIAQTQAKALQEVADPELQKLKDAEDEARGRAEEGRDELQVEIQSLEGRLASLGTLRTQRLQHQEELRRIQAQLNALQEPAEVNAAKIVIPTEDVAEAERMDERLQADLTAWARQSERLRSETLTTLEMYEGALAEVSQAAQAAGNGMNELLAGDVADVAREDVEALHKLVVDWGAAVTAFQVTYEGLQSRLVEVEPVEVLSVLDEKWFEAVGSMENLGSEKVSNMSEKLAAIGRTGEEPTRRLVLQNRLSQELRPLEDAWAEASKGLQELLPSRNRVLAGLLESVRNVKPRIDNRRKTIAADLRNRELDRQRLVVHEKRVEIGRKRTELLDEERRILKELNDLGDQLTESYLSLRDSTGKLRHAGRRLFDDLQSMPATQVSESTEEVASIPEIKRVPIRFRASGPGSTGDQWPLVLRYINIVGSLIIILLITIRFARPQV